jgi:hypothetical protein
VRQLVVPDLPDWEVQYKRWQRERRQRYLKVLPADFTQPDSARASGGQGQAGWEPAPEVTDADRNGDMHSLHRALTNRLFLILKMRGALPSFWGESEEGRREKAGGPLRGRQRRGRWQVLQLF